MSNKPNDINDDQLPLWENQDMPTKTTTETLSFAYHGEAVDDGTIDAEAFGSAIIGYTQMVKAAISEVAPTVQVPHVRFVRTAQGSFITYVTTTIDQSIIDAVRNILASDNGTALANGITIITGTVVTAGWLVRQGVALRKKIKDKNAQVDIDDKTNNATITYDDGTRETVPQPLYNITINNNFRSGVYQVTELVTLDGIDSVSFNTEEGEEEEPVTLEAHDRIAFTPVVSSDTDTVRVTQERLDIVRLSFDDGHWRFRRTLPGGVEQEFTAAMEDQSFTESIISLDIPFRAGDKLDVQLEETISRPRGRRTQRSYRVLRVIKVISSDREDPLPGL